jgi:hypothetical protein
MQRIVPYSVGAMRHHAVQCMWLSTWQVVEKLSVADRCQFALQLSCLQLRYVEQSVNPYSDVAIPGEGALDNKVCRQISIILPRHLVCHIIETDVVTKNKARIDVPMLVSTVTVVIAVQLTFGWRDGDGLKLCTRTHRSSPIFFTES